MLSRFATASDKEHISHLLDELIEETLLQGATPTKIPINQKERENMFLDLLKRPDVKIFVIEKNGEILAFADVFIVPVMRRAKYYALVEDFVVTKSMRRKGVGTTLLRTIMEYCKKHNIRVIRLTSGLELEPAHQFYEKMGGKFTEKMYRFDL